MKRFMVVVTLALMMVFGTVCIGRATPLDDAKALAEKAAVYVKANGKDKGIAEIGNPKGQFVKGGDLYVVLQDFNGFNLANPMSPIAGKNFLDVKDASGKFFFREMIEVAKTKGGGWVTDSWTNPATKKVQSKK